MGRVGTLSVARLSPCPAVDVRPARDDGLVTSATVRIRVQASARRDEIVAVRDGVLVIRVTAPAIEGRANESARRLLAKRLGVPRSAITIVRGHRSRDKLVAVDGVDEATVLGALTS